MSKTLLTSLRDAMASDGIDLPRIAQRDPATSGRRDDETAGPRAMDAAALMGSGRLVGTIPDRASVELAAMHAVLAELLPLSVAERARVLQWVVSVIDTAARNGELPLPNQEAPPWPPSDART